MLFDIALISLQRDEEQNRMKDSVISWNFLNVYHSFLIIRCKFGLSIISRPKCVSQRTNYTELWFIADVYVIGMTSDYPVRRSTLMSLYVHICKSEGGLYFNLRLLTGYICTEPILQLLYYIRCADLLIWLHIAHPPR